MAPGVRAPDGTVGAKLRLEPAHAFAAAAHRLRPAPAGAGLPKRSPRFIPGRAAPQGGPPEAALALGALHDRPWPAAAVLGLLALLLALRVLQQCTAAMATIARGQRRLKGGGT